MDTTMKKFTYDYKGYTLTVHERSNGYYGWINGIPFTRGLHKTSKAGNNLFSARRAVENAVDLFEIENNQFIDDLRRRVQETL